MTGTELENVEFDEIRGMAGVKEATIKIGDLDVNIAVVNGIGNVDPILDQVQNGTSNIIL